MSLGQIVGLLLGGVIYAHGRYHAVFELMFAMLGVDAVLRLVMIEKDLPRRHLARRDFPRINLPRRDLPRINLPRRDWPRSG